MHITKHRLKVPAAVALVMLAWVAALWAQFGGGGSARVPRKQVYYFTNVNMVVDGDSMSVQTAAAVFPGGTPNVADYVNQKCHGLSFTNFAVWGQSTSNMFSDAVSQIDAAYDSNKVNVLITHIGYNDWQIPFPDATAFQFYTNYVTGRAARGYRVVMSTMALAPHTANGTLVWWTNYNNMVRTGWQTAGAVALADIGNDARFNDPNDTASYTNSHFTESRMRIQADYYWEAMVKAVYGGL